jgi:hypothetical protein
VATSAAAQTKLKLNHAFRRIARPSFPNLRCRLREALDRTIAASLVGRTWGSTEISGRKKKCLLLPRQSSNREPSDSRGGHKVQGRPCRRFCAD